MNAALNFLESVVKKVCIFIFSLIISAVSIASDKIEGEITELAVNSLVSNGALVGTGEVFISACRVGNNQSTKYLVIDFSEPGMQEAYSLALAAYMSNKPVVMMGSSSNCSGQFEKLKSISFKKI
jgi:hypothetical protein